MRHSDYMKPVEPVTIYNAFNNILSTQYEEKKGFVINIETKDISFQYVGYMDMEETEDKIIIKLINMTGCIKKKIGTITLYKNKLYELEYLPNARTLYLQEHQEVNSRNAGRKSNLDLDVIADYYNQGMTMEWIANEMGVSVGTISNQIKKARAKGLVQPKNRTYTPKRIYRSW